MTHTRHRLARSPRPGPLVASPQAATEARDVEGKWHSLTYGPHAGRSSAGVRVTDQTALTFTAFYAAVNRIATDMASLSLAAFERQATGRREAPEQPADRVFAVEPNEEMDAFRFRQTEMAKVLMRGNAISELEFTRGGDLAKAWPQEAGTAWADRTPQSKRLYYEFDNGKRTLPPYKVLHLAGPGPDGITGWSILRLAKTAIGLGLAAETFGATFYGNASVPKGAVSLPGVATPEMVANLRESIGAIHQGPENAHKPIILEGGATWTNTTIAPDEAQFLQTRQFQVVEIARLFGLPPHKIGDYTQSHRANVEEANLDYFVTTLMGWIRMFESAVNRRAFAGSDRGRYYLEFNAASFLRGNMAARAQFYKEMLALGAITSNEIRRRENFDPIGEAGDQHIIPANMSTLERLASGVTAPPTAPPKTAADPTAA